MIAESRCKLKHLVKQSLQLFIRVAIAIPEGRAFEYLGGSRVSRNSELSPASLYEYQSNFATRIRMKALDPYIVF